MATGLKSRIAYKTPTASATSGDYWAGTYKLLIRAKTIPSPFGSQNMVDTSTLEDLVRKIREKKRLKRKPVKKNKLAEICELAKSKGMSYGQYMAEQYKKEVMIK